MSSNYDIPGYGNISGIPADAPITGWENIGDIISRLLTYIYPLAGMAAFVYLLWGGIHLMIAAGNEEGIREGKAKITNALVGFLIIFVSYWLVQILGTILGVDLL